MHENPACQFSKASTASEEKGLGSGRVDHWVALLIGKKVRGIDLEAVTFQVNRRLRFDAGLPFGVDRETPQVSVVAGLRSA